MEADRQRLLAIERLIELKGALEILRLSDLIFELERHAASQKLVKFAWRIAIDW